MVDVVLVSLEFSNKDSPIGSSVPRSAARGCAPEAAVTGCRGVSDPEPDPPAEPADAPAPAPDDAAPAAPVSRRRRWLVAAGALLALGLAAVAVWMVVRSRGPRAP